MNKMNKTVVILKARSLSPNDLDATKKELEDVGYAVIVLPADTEIEVLPANLQA